MMGFQQPGGFRRFAVGVLDRLSFVENDGIECDVLEQSRIAPQRAISRQHNVGVLNFIPAVRPLRAGMVAHAQTRGKAGGFLLLVEDQ
jgi:hypothetical protein